MRRMAGGIQSNTAGEGVEQQHANTEHRENRRSRTEKRKLEGELSDFFLPSSPLSWFLWGCLFGVFFGITDKTYKSSSSFSQLPNILHTPRMVSVPLPSLFPHFQLPPVPPKNFPELLSADLWHLLLVLCSYTYLTRQVEVITIGFSMQRHDLVLRRQAPMRQIAESWELATAVCCSSTCFQKEKVHLQKPEVIILESVYIWNGKSLFKIKAQEVQQQKGAGGGCRGCVSCSTVCPLALFKPCPHPCSETGANSSKAASWSPDQHDLEEFSQPKLHEGISKPHPFCSPAHWSVVEGSRFCVVPTWGS